MGRPKQERVVDTNVAARIKQRVRAEETWVAIIETEKHRLRLDLPVEERPPNVSTIPLSNMLKYQDDRHLGRTTENVNHIHDKPLEVNMNVNLAEGIARARKRLK